VWPDCPGHADGELRPAKAIPSLLPGWRSFDEFRVLQKFLQTLDVLVVFGADVFPEADAFTQHHCGAGFKRLCEDLLVLDGCFLVDRVVVDSCVPFCNVERVGVKDSSGEYPAFVVEPDDIHDQRVSFPMSD